jgi:hypothetical protein
MKKKQISLGILVFVLGFILGGLSLATYFGYFIRKTGESLSSHFRADWERRAFEAYSEENPQVAIWALENLADILEGYLEVTKRDKDFIREDLVLTYARLAIASQAAKDTQKYHENICKGLALSRQAYPAGLQREEELLNFVRKVDSSANKKPKQ